MFWWRRRDVYRLLLSLSTRVDGITWPEADRKLVEQMQDLIRTVTGVSLLQPWFTQDQGRHQGLDWRTLS